jgi:hypothetical protein
MPLLEQHVGYMVIARIYEEALYLPDLTIKSMFGLTATYFCFTQRDNVVDDDRRAVSQAHADSHAGGRTSGPQATGAAVALDRLGLAVPAPVIRRPSPSPVRDDPGIRFGLAS